MPLQAQSTVTPPFSVDAFGAEHGLPGHQVYDIAQTSDGYLWVATNGGLARFDGHRFLDVTAQLAPPLETLLITHLYVGRSDTLYAISSRGDVLRYADGHLERHPSTPTVLAPSLVFGANRVEPVASQFWAPYEARSPHGGIVKDGSGTPWVVIRERSAEAPPPDPMPTCDGERPDAGWVLARIDPSGPRDVRPSPFRRVLQHPSRGEVLSSRVVDETIELTSTSGASRGRFALPRGTCPLLLSRDGLLWTKSRSEVAAYEQGASTPRIRFPIGTAVPPVLEDREGTIWIGTSTDGIYRIRRNAIQVYTPFDVAGKAMATVEAGRGGSVLLHAGGQAVYRVEAGRITPLFAGDEQWRGQGFYEDNLGRRLAVTEIPGTVLERVTRYRNGSQAPLFDVNFVDGSIRSQFYPDPIRDNTLWLYNGCCAYRLTDPMGATPTLDRATGGHYRIRHLHRDRQGTVWIGTEEGLVRLDRVDEPDGPQATVITTADGLPHPHVRYVHEDPDGVLWLGTYGGGLVRYKDGQFASITEDDGLGENIVAAILEDEAGIFWMSGNQGLHRASRADLNTFLDGRLDRVPAVQYGRESGLLNPETVGYSSYAAPDGRLWFPTFHGAAVVDPAVARELGREPPIAQAEGLRVGDSLRIASGPVQLAAHERRFTIPYIGLTFRHPEAVTYRYRLDGLDADWVEAGTAREATYTNVPPGAYTFRVQARNRTGVWSEADGTLALTVAPFFYETRWFAGLCLVVVLALLTGGYRARVQHVRKREAELDALVRERTEDLEREKETVAAQAAMLRSLDEAKSQLFANVSHEFRTPLTLILGPLEDLQDGALGPLPPGMADYVGGAIDNSRRLLRLVNQLLDIARLESGRLVLQARALDAVAFTARSVKAFGPWAERSRVSLRFEGPGQPVIATLDPEQYEKVLTNLLGNALKFTPEGGSVAVTLHKEPGTAGPGALVLTVEDNGPGIAPQHLHRVFERFYQADASPTRRQEGTGIGLALTRQLVERHGGTVKVTSTVGEGTTFRARFPLGQAHFHDADLADPSATDPDDAVDIDLGGNGIAGASSVLLTSAVEAGQNGTVSVPPDAAPDATTVLVVDDNPDIRAYVRRHLARHYCVLEAADGQAALDLARAALPDLVVSDVMMPELDGFELCRALKSDPELDYLPVILLTARAEVEDRLTGLEGGADAYLTKPFDVRELGLRVENLIVSRQRLKARYLQAARTERPDAPGAEEPGATTREADAPAADPFEQEARAVIAARLSEDDLSVATLAAALGLGRTTLYSRFADTFGQSPMDVVWSMRLEQATALLRRSEGTVSEVAYGVGFKSVAHFCNRFRDTYGTTPAQYAAEHEDRSA
ncbi:MAG: ATP-binding protein [Bacteroidota bacterium]